MDNYKVQITVDKGDLPLGILVRDIGGKPVISVPTRVMETLKVKVDHKG